MSMLRIAPLTFLALFTGLLACGDEGPVSPRGQDPVPPGALRMTVPESALHGEPFPVTVEALSTSGGRDGAWNGVIRIQSSVGAVAPDSIRLSSGVGSGDLTVSGATGEVTLMARVGSGSGGASAESPLLVLSAEPAMRLVIEPSSFLLPGVGEAMELTALAFDDAGNPAALPEDLVWASSDLAMDVDGAGGGVAVATASSLGSAQVTVEAEGVVSGPSLGLVAAPAEDVVLVPDSQVVSALEAVDPEADFVPGWRYTARLTGAAPAEGDLVLGTGEAPLAGRVVLAEADGEETVVTLELVPLSELFDRLVVDETLPLVDATDVTAPFGLSPASGAGSRGYAIGAAPGGPLPVGLDDHEFTAGPFTCTASFDGPSLDLGSPSYELTPSLALRFAYDDGLEQLSIAGGIEATFDYEPRIRAVVSGEASCERVVRTLIIPIGGALSFLLGAQVPVGVGLSLNGELTVAEVGFDVGAEAGASVELGIVCPGGESCSGLSEVDGSADATFEFVSPDPVDGFHVELGGYGFGFAKLSLGSPLSRAWQFDAFEARAGLEQTVDLATAHKQASDPDYASGFWLVARAEAGPGSDLSDALDKLGKRLGIELDASTLRVIKDDTVARSPRGSFGISPETVAPGDSSELGELAAFTATLDPVTYLGMEAVDRVEFLWRHDDSEAGPGSFTLEPNRPSCVSVPGGGGRTQFRCETDFLEEHEGLQEFHAFVYPRLFGVPLPVPLELAPESRAQVVVAADVCDVPLAEHQVPGIVDESYTDLEYDRGSGSAQITGPVMSHASVTASAWSQADSDDWAPTAILSARAEDYIRVVPHEPVDPMTFLNVVVETHASASVSVSAENCCGTTGDATADLRLVAGLLAEDILVRAGSDCCTDLGPTDEVQLSEVTRVLWIPEDWRYSQVWLTGRFRHRGAGNRAEGSIAFTMRVLDVEDQDGNSVPATICSAAGYDYRAGAMASDRGVVASRPVRQKASGDTDP